MLIPMRKQTICANNIFNFANMFALLVLVPLSSGGLVSKFEPRSQYDPGCPQITNGPLLTIPVWPPDITGQTVQVEKAPKISILMTSLGCSASSRSILLYLRSPLRWQKFS